MAELKALCMSCMHSKGKDQKMQVMKDVKITEKDGKYSARGQCSSCGKNMFKFLNKEQAEALK